MFLYVFGSILYNIIFFFFSSRRRHTRFKCDWSSDVCSSDLPRCDSVLAGCRCRQKITACRHYSLQKSDFSDRTASALATAIPRINCVLLPDCLLKSGGCKCSAVSRCPKRPHRQYRKGSQSCNIDCQN